MVLAPGRCDSSCKACTLYSLSARDVRDAGEFRADFRLAETEGFEPSIGLYKPITV